MRYDLFSRLDDGVRLDAAGLFGVKPERLALRMARRVRGATVLDALCGIGGTAIAFARAGKQVVTCDIDADRLDMARQNARVYGVEDRIRFVLDDVREVMARESADAVYLDPPWGGPAALERETFRLVDYRLDGRDLLERAFRMTPEVVLTVPPHFDLNELRDLDRDFSLARAVRNGELLYFDISFR